MFLFVELLEGTEKIDAVWNVKIWQDGKRVLDKEIKYRFKNSKGRGIAIEINDTDLLVAFTIKKWNVTKKTKTKK